jgi:hypothetical protein
MSPVVAFGLSIFVFTVIGESAHAITEENNKKKIMLVVFLYLVVTLY